MLPLLAFAVVAVQGAEPAAFRETLKSVGYPFTSTSAAGNSGRIDHAGAAVNARLDVRFGAKGEMVGGVRSLRLSTELSFPKEMPEGRSPILLEWEEEKQTVTTSFVSHLGGTVSVRKSFVVDPSLTPRVLRAKLDDFWQEIKEFAVSHKGRFAPTPEVDWTEHKFPDETILERADPVSLRRLTDSWGWTYRGGWGGSGVPRWNFPIDIGGKYFWLQQCWEHRNLAEDRFGIASFESPETSEIIQLGKGMQVGEVKRRIEAFARGKT